MLAAAAEGIARLNRRYGPAPGGERFLLLHRRRVWNEGERRWMGWERKRGKLHELNRLLRGATDTTFIADRGRRRGCRPTCAMSSRSTPTRGCRATRVAADRQDGASAQPAALRRRPAAVSSRATACCSRASRPSLPVGREGSLFQRIFSSISGIDPYASAVSDVYQDLFGEGSYTGKGIYESTRSRRRCGRVPENTLLSHDLFEGMFARAGLASDVEVVEEFPARYDVAASRQHRWARGDWQLLPWIFGRGPADGSGGAIPAMGRWKMLDNLRRTLSAPAAVLALLAGLEPAAGSGGHLDVVRSRHDRVADPDSGGRWRSCRARPGIIVAQSSRARSAPICDSPWRNPAR